MESARKKTGAADSRRAARPGRGGRVKVPPLIEPYKLAAAGSIVCGCTPDLLYSSRKHIASAARIGVYMAALACGETKNGLRMAFDISGMTLDGLLERAKADLFLQSPRGVFIRTVHLEVIPWAWLCSESQLNDLMPATWPPSYDPQLRHYLVGSVDWEAETAKLRSYPWKELSSQISAASLSPIRDTSFATAISPARTHK